MIYFPSILTQHPSLNRGVTTKLDPIQYPVLIHVETTSYNIVELIKPRCNFSSLNEGWCNESLPSSSM